LGYRLCCGSAGPTDDLPPIEHPDPAEREIQSEERGFGLKGVNYVNFLIEVKRFGFTGEGFEDKHLERVFEQVGLDYT